MHFDAARKAIPTRPRVHHLSDTLMCKGVPFLEDRDITHFIRVEADEWAKAHWRMLEEEKPQ